MVKAQQLIDAAREMARKGGQSRSARKKASSRRNGRMGGRPRKPLTPEQIRPI